MGGIRGGCCAALSLGIWMFNLKSPDGRSGMGKGTVRNV